MTKLPQQFQLLDRPVICWPWILIHGIPRILLYLSFSCMIKKREDWTSSLTRSLMVLICQTQNIRLSMFGGLQEPLPHGKLVVHGFVGNPQWTSIIAITIKTGDVIRVGNIYGYSDKEVGLRGLFNRTVLSPLRSTPHFLGREHLSIPRISIFSDWLPLLGSPVGFPDSDSHFSNWSSSAAIFAESVVLKLSSWIIGFSVTFPFPWPFLCLGSLVRFALALCIWSRVLLALYWPNQWVLGVLGMPGCP